MERYANAMPCRAVPDGICLLNAAKRRDSSLFTLVTGRTFKRDDGRCYFPSVWPIKLKAKDIWTRHTAVGSLSAAPWVGVVKLTETGPGHITIFVLRSTAMPTMPLAAVPFRGSPRIITAQEHSAVGHISMHLHIGKNTCLFSTAISRPESTSTQHGATPAWIPIHNIRYNAPTLISSLRNAGVIRMVSLSTD